ncbi:V-type ATP synthase subunit F [Tissierella creatinophila]|uniref:V-type ATP synthase subunit F n=1 Tax=Tissierella creatinophila DSM 6911 TaxID=1123403 RepID=A0A1U7M8W3_TISCR|nr:V-type ATP synthase subunit F [Tissierella creatinophila]OLS03638.1 V-type ATP synthase subunit F [Tissierella creatinophila DSM 6911]
MKSFLISDNKDTLWGLRLSGIEGVLVNTDEEIKSEFKRVINNPEIGIVILTEDIFEEIKDEVLEFKLSSDTPLITTIPDIGGLRDKNFIMRYVKESIGIKI